MRLDRQRYVDGHLVTVKVCVVGGTHQGVQLNGLTLNEHRFESLNAQPVQRGRPVQQYRMLTDDLSQNIPNLGRLALYHLLCSFDGARQTAVLQLTKDKGLKEF